MRWLTLWVVLAATTLVAHPAHAAETEDDPPVPADCSQHRQMLPGVYLQEHTIDVFGGIAGTPARAVIEIEPGTTRRFCVGFQNRSSGVAQIAASTVDFGPDPDGLPMGFDAGEGDFGAAQWLNMTVDQPVRVERGDQLWFEVTARIPEGAPPGSHYAGIVGRLEPVDTDRQKEGTELKAAVAIQVFFDLPGEADNEGRLVDVDSPRVVWWDGIDVSELPGLGKLRGLGIAPMRFRWENTGDYSHVIDGRVSIKSDITGKDVARLDMDKGIVMRGADRRFEVTWQRGIPMLGKFTPTLELFGPDGKRINKELPAIWVIPSWWYFVALALAVALPLWMRHRSRREYRELLARLEAAEIGGGEFEDEFYAEDDDWVEHR